MTIVFFYYDKCYNNLFILITLTVFHSHKKCGY